MNRKNHLVITAVLVAIGAVLSYFLISGEVIGFGLLELPIAASTQAVTIDQIIHGHMAMQAVLFAIIMVPLIYAVTVFRRQEGDETDAPHIHGNTTVEIIWTVVPVVLVVSFAIWGVQSYQTVLASSPDEQVIRTQAQRWDWNFYYPEHDNRSNFSLVVQVDRPVLLEMQSIDVIHAFWVPGFRIKQDVVPYNVDVDTENFSNFETYDAEATNYKPTHVRFTPTVTGVYRLLCAEICGTNHYAMLANVHVLDAADYQAWVDGELTLPSDPNQTNTQEINADGSVNDAAYLPELIQYCLDKYGNEACVGE